MQSVYEAAGGSGCLLRLAEAWQSRVMADETVSHAFSHGFHSQHSERLAAYWARSAARPPRPEEKSADPPAATGAILPQQADRTH